MGVAILKKCPFCGHTANLLVYYPRKYAMVKCNKCSAKMTLSSKAAAIKAWNRRDGDV